VDLANGTYWGVVGLTFLGPFILGFHKSLSFNKKWPKIATAIIPILIVYIPWDIWFTSQRIWSFNTNYLGGQFCFNLPIEEILFFVATPFSCLFVLECTRYYFPSLLLTHEKKILHRVSNWTMIFIIAIAILLISRNKTGWYTLSATLTGLIGLGYLYKNRKEDFLQILVTWIILLVPFYICNGILTGIHFWQYPFINQDKIAIENAVVLYNNSENSGIRIWSVPAEDFFYGFGFYSIAVSVYRRKEKQKL